MLIYSIWLSSFMERFDNIPEVMPFLAGWGRNGGWDI
jgi:hypothetical protein